MSYSRRPRILNGVNQSLTSSTCWSAGTWGVLIMSMALLLPAPVQSEDAGSETSSGDESWQVIYLQGQRVGYLHGRTWTSTVDGQLHYWSESVSRMSIKRFGETLTITVSQTTEEDPDGDLIAFKCRTENPPFSQTTIIGTVVDGELKLTTETAGKSTQQSKTWDPDVKSPAYQDRLLQSDPLNDGETRSFRIYDPQLGDFATLDLHGEGPAETKLLDGSLRVLPLVTIRHSLLPLVTIRTFLGPDGETLKTETSLLGMEAFAVTRDEALKAIEGADLDLAVATLVPVEGLTRPHESKSIVYEITAADPHLLEMFPTGASQTVTPVDADTIRLNVSGVAPDSSQAGAPVAEEYRAASRYLDSADHAIIDLANKGAGDATDPARVAVNLEQFVYREIRKKNFSTAPGTASEVVRNLEGDCTEHAMLLAAMLRSGDPLPGGCGAGVLRTAFRLRRAHVDGGLFRWAMDTSGCDPGPGGIGAGHLKIADSSLSDEGPDPLTAFLPLVECLGRIQIDVSSTK